LLYFMFILIGHIGIISIIPCVFYGDFMVKVLENKSQQYNLYNGIYMMIIDIHRSFIIFGTFCMIFSLMQKILNFLF
jgi:hypothetical protein